MHVVNPSRLGSRHRNLLSLAMFSLSLAASGCISTRPSFDNPYASVGTEHNKGLDYVLAEIQKPSSGSPPTTRQDGVRIVAEATRRFLALNGTSSELIRVVDEGVAISELPDDPGDPLAGIETLPSLERPYVRRMLAALQSDKSIASTRRTIATEARKAVVNLGVERSRNVLIGAAVADSSLAYWERNLDAWSLAVANAYQANPPENPPVKEKDIVGADVKGAIKGAIAGLLTTGPGGVLEGAVIGAISSSVAEAVSDFFSSLFS